MVSCWTLTAMLRGESFYLHFKDEESEEQRASNSYWNAASFQQFSYTSSLEEISSGVLKSFFILPFSFMWLHYLPPGWLIVWGLSSVGGQPRFPLVLDGTRFHLVLAQTWWVRESHRYCDVGPLGKSSEIYKSSSYKNMHTSTFAVPFHSGPFMEASYGPW